jgi:hypothetical protein
MAESGDILGFYLADSRKEVVRHRNDRRSVVEASNQRFEFFGLDVFLVHDKTKVVCPRVRLVGW